jgi:inner membrane protein
MTEKSTIKYQKPLTKVLLIGILVLVLLIPMEMIKGLIRERTAIAEDATREVYQSWSGPQTITGPVLSMTLKIQNKDAEGKTNIEYNTYNILPNKLNINGNIDTKELKRGIYEIVVYNAPIDITGSFVCSDELKNIMNNGEIAELINTSIYLGISDLRGISDEVTLNFGEQQLSLNSGMPSCALSESGLSSTIDISSLLEGNVMEFSTKLTLKGSKSIDFLPLGKTTTVALTSNCTTPSFAGSFLPANREVTKDGFTSDWKVVQVNRNYPQVIAGNAYYRAVNDSKFGVNVLIPLQHYQKSMRTVKYAILIILLTFVVSFFVEMIQKKDIHPVQYLLIGLALCLFYSLLVSISEHTSFTIAYIIAALMTDGLITCYLAGVLKIKKTALAIGGLLLALYAFIFVLLQLESYALLAGSIGLFVLLAVLMHYSQKIDWYKTN